MSKESISKVYLILEKIEYIEQIVKNAGSITGALEDYVTDRPAILMHLTAIAEQFNKLKQSHADGICNCVLMIKILKGCMMSEHTSLMIMKVSI
jgi:alpha-amylase/alpha-mannosidase (GH57 family)